MKIHEYQAKAILARYGVTTPRGEVAFTKEEAREGAQRLKANIVVVKAQIHAGGRGKAGGVKLAHSPDEAAEIASKMLGMNLVTVQTGPSGRIVKRLLIEEGLDIKRELYLSLLVDRASARVSGQEAGVRSWPLRRSCQPCCAIFSGTLSRVCRHRRFHAGNQSLRLDR
jgi:succinyl-CoA synthetase beta subunit